MILRQRHILIYWRKVLSPDQSAMCGQYYPKALFELLPMREDTSEIAIWIIHNSNWRLLAFFYRSRFKIYIQYIIIQFIQVFQICMQARNSHCMGKIWNLHGNLKNQVQVKKDKKLYCNYHLQFRNNNKLLNPRKTRYILLKVDSYISLKVESYILLKVKCDFTIAS